MPKLADTIPGITLTTVEQADLHGMLRHPQPHVGADLTKLIDAGLVIFSHESVTGRTYFKLTPAGRAGTLKLAGAFRAQDKRNKRRSGDARGNPNQSRDVEGDRTSPGEAVREGASELGSEGHGEAPPRSAVRVIAQGDIRRCAFLILAAEHYRDDGTCRCDDPRHSQMRKWGYRWKDGRWT
jgi:hypothetical protein